jgi:lipopolysaccharide export system permease protein
MLDIIDKYIAKLFLSYFFGSILVLFTLFVTIDAMSTFVGIQTPIINIVKFYLYSTPALIYQLLPAASLIATLFTLGGLNKNNELVALFSIGNSLARVSAPILIIVSAVTVVSFWMSDRILPITNKKKNYTWIVEIKKHPGRYAAVKNSKIWYRQDNMLFNIKTFDNESKVAQGLSFYYFDDKWDLVQMIVAKKATLLSKEWKLESGTVTLFTGDSSFPMNQNFDEKSIIIDDEIGDIQESSRFSEVVSIKELKQYIKKNKEAGLNTLRYEVDLHSKYGFALAAFVMAFIGIPFSTFNNRAGGRMLSVGMCIGLAFGYWSLLSIGMTMGRHGYVAPIIGAWVPNIFMLGLSTFFLLRLKK